jgi:hypothetical protein
MTANHLHFKEHVGTTYKRALERIHLPLDCVIPRDFMALSLIENSDNWSVLTTQLEDELMRKPRDFDAALKALTDKARQLKEQKLRQLGELVIACQADTMPLEQLAGALLSAAETKEPATKEAWRKRGAAFFQGARKSGGVHRDDVRRDQENDGGASSAAGEDRA